MRQRIQRPAQPDMFASPMFGYPLQALMAQQAIAAQFAEGYNSLAAKQYAMMLQQMPRSEQ